MALVYPDAQRLGIGSRHLENRHNPPSLVVDEDVGIGLERAEPAPHYKLHSLPETPDFSTRMRRVLVLRRCAPPLSPSTTALRASAQDDRATCLGRGAGGRAARPRTARLGLATSPRSVVRFAPENTAGIWLRRLRAFAGGTSKCSVPACARSRGLG